MESWFRVDWSSLFTPKLSLPEMILRGVIIYVGLCLLLRIVLKRQAGKVSLSDLLVVTLVAGICRNPLVADAYSIPDGLGVVAVVLFTSYVADWLSYHLPIVHTIMHPKRVQLIEDGHVRRRNLARELMTESQLRSQLRQQGVHDPADVAEAWIESSGEISVVRKRDRAVEDSLRRHEERLEELCARLERAVHA